MKLEKKTIITLEITEAQLAALIRGTSQRLMGWAEAKIDSYRKEMMQESGPQHYLSGLEAYTLFEDEFKEEFLIWEKMTDFPKSLRGMRLNQVHECMRLKEIWVGKFISIQKEYDDSKKAKP